MCNNYECNVDWPSLQAALDEAGLVAVAGGKTPLPPCADVRVGDTNVVLCPSGNGVAAVPMTWGFPPPRPKAAPVYNFRGENRDFRDSKRCLIPASAFFEFTGAKAPKSKWRFAMPDAPVFAIAGLWRQPDLDHSNCAFTMLTLPPGPDVAPFHDRQIVTLAPAEWSKWLYLDSSSPAFAGPPKTRLEVSLARAGREPPPQALLSLAEHAVSAGA